MSLILHNIFVIIVLLCPMNMFLLSYSLILVYGI